MLKKALLLSLLSSFLFSVTLFAEENEEKNPLALSLGVAANYSESIYRQNKSRFTPFPLIDMNYGDFYFKGIQAGYKIPIIKDLHIVPTITYQFDGYDRSGDYLTGMEKRQDAIYGGVRASYSHGGHSLYTSYNHDISGRNNGYLVDVGYNYFKMLKPFVLSPTIEYHRKSANYSNYYYGVKNSEATTYRHAYQPGATETYSASMLTMYYVNKKLYLLLSLSYEFLNSKITDSPIINKDGRFSSYIGVAYKLY